MAGVYISYPFCQQKCSFCNFASDVAGASTREAYHTALLAEMRAHAWTWQPETIYFGGGTPSLMPFSLLEAIFDTIPSVGLREVTIECAPGTLTADHVRAWRQLGVNRVSLGVQSFVREELRLTGRQHLADDVARDVELLRTVGIENLNLDLIAGLPEQTHAGWNESLDWIERLRVPHVSVYLFEADGDSRLGRQLLSGGSKYGAARMPSEEAMAVFYEHAVERLHGMGCERYEISNFARAGFESLHNLKYWKLEPYVGFGLDAHSYDGRARWSNPDSLPLYLKHRAKERMPADRSEERFFVGLRLMQGIEPSAEEWIRFAVPIAKWSDAGMLEREGSRLRLTPAAVLVSNEIFAEFIDN